MEKLNVFQKLIRSLDTVTKNAYSARKLTALFSFIVAAYITYTLPLDVRLHALYAWQMLGLLCLGIITVQNVIELKNGNITKTETTTTTSEQKNEA